MTDSEKLIRIQTAINDKIKILERKIEIAQYNGADSFSLEIQLDMLKQLIRCVEE